MLTAIIVAGGSSQRMGFDKLLAPINGKPVVAHSIAAFEQSSSVGDIILVARAERLSDWEICAGVGFRKIPPSFPWVRRQDSVGADWTIEARDGIRCRSRWPVLVSADLDRDALSNSRATMAVRRAPRRSSIR
jgi:hypothetical protein